MHLMKRKLHNNFIKKKNKAFEAFGQNSKIEKLKTMKFYLNMSKNFHHKKINDIKSEYQ